MPVSKPADLPAGGGGRWPHLASGWRSAQWGDLEVGYTEPSEVLEFNPASTLKLLMDHIEQLAGGGDLDEVDPTQGAKP